MAITTYNDLVAVLIAWCNQSAQDAKFIAQIPNFIFLAEQQIFQDIPTLGNQDYLEATFTIANGIYPKPALWGRTLDISYINAGNLKVLERISYEYGLEYMQTLAVGPPQYYTDYAYGYFQVFPSPDVEYPFQFVYYKEVPQLSLTNQSNWTSLNASDMLFDLAMSKANLYLKDYPAAEKWENLYKDRVKAYNDYDQSRLLDRSADITTKAIPKPTPTIF